MPTFDFTKHGTHVERFYEILSTMTFPDNCETRYQFVDTEVINWLCQLFKNQHGATLPIPGRFIDYPSRTSLWDSWKREAHYGYVSGTLFVLMFYMKYTGKAPVLERAIKMVLLCMKSAAKDKQYQSVRDGRTHNRAALIVDGKEKAWSRSAIIERWKHFKSVSHLWAALIMFNLSGRDMECILNKKDVFYEFLSLSEYFRIFGEATEMGGHGLRKKILSSNNIWRLPPDFERHYSSGQHQFKLEEEFISRLEGIYQQVSSN